MKTITIPETSLDRLIEGLENAIKVSYTALNNPDQLGYPYATVYSRATMKETIKTLEALKEQFTQK
jgi:hypothetical protein